MYCFYLSSKNDCLSHLNTSLIVFVLLFYCFFVWQASERELQWVIKVSVLIVGLAGMGLAFGGTSVLALWLMSGDLLYCVIFPQLVCVLHFPYTNIYGAISGFLSGFLLRLLSGEPLLAIPAALLYPGWKEENGIISQRFPYRTVAMLSSLITIIMVSYLIEVIFSRHLIPQSWDVLGGLQSKKQTEEENQPNNTDDRKLTFSTNL